MGTFFINFMYNDIEILKSHTIYVDEKARRIYMKIIAIMITKLAAFGLRLIGRGGSLPGTIALKIDPNILQKLQMSGPIVLVTGTNGKTSTANMLTEAFLADGKHVISNRKGDNLLAGVTTTMLTNADLRGRIKADAAVLEVDELNIPYIIKGLPVSALVVTNFFRDQLDRAKEMEQLISRIENSISDFKGMLILNANDPNVVRLSDVAKHAKALYYGIKRCKSSLIETSEASEGKFCPRCGSRLHYRFYQYSHIGEFACEACDFSTPPLDAVGEVVSIPKRTFLYDGMSFEAPQGGLYTMYNCMAVLCCAKYFGVSQEAVKQGFANFVVPDGRNETFTRERQTLILNLIKNPTGANEVMKVIEEDAEERSVLVVLNDNTQDGCDISWIYDTHFEKLLSTSTKHIIISGTRCYDMALRLKYSGYDPDKLIIKESLSEAVEALFDCDGKLYVVATYTALQPVRTLIVNKIKGGKS
ncbi:Mur ligase middle domain protein [Amedibacillus dolichus DSM 3991]|uniref:Lipid II isoglutaminyl synthase (glutamine-hydrolyzing) subunit MurT n=4 Tax=Amedibacillus dolichus TaxID=31971 RepID=A8RBJ9_9FIRM|nr:Mur ligase middle domain protein [Amedibacillus dolichus DSM 3991]